MVMVPVPAAVANTVVVDRMLYADADIGAERSDMGAHAHALAADACARADRTDIGSSANLLGHRRAGKEQSAGKS